MARLNPSVALLVASISIAGASLAAQSRTPRAARARNSCSDPLAIQVLLDREGFSAGEIDGQLGANAQHALAAFQQSRGLDPSGQPDCATWAALGGESADQIKTTYQILPADTGGPFAARIPTELDRQADLPALRYRSVAELLGEKFHTAPDLLARLNPGKPFASGASIVVPNVTPFDPNARPDKAPKTAAVTLEVSQDDTLRVVGADGSTLFFAPVSSGSEHDPLPLGQWKVTSVTWLPAFHYNPELFWDADANQTKATIKPGPNNPVGVVWIGIDAEHYGLHGTPEPSHVGHTESHGCVRLTNWDAAKVAGLVAVGTPVIFK